MENYKIIAPTEDELKKAHESYILHQKNNRNNFSYWFWKIQSVKKFGIGLPNSVTIPIGEKLLNAFFHENKGDDEIIRSWVEKTLQPSLKNVDLPTFMKNGCFSNKFDFENSCLIRSIDVDTLVAHLNNIQYPSLCFDTMGNMEIVLREWIEPEVGTECIYCGMPLRPEMRVFYDFTHHKYLYDVNYWDWEYCHDAICRNKVDGEVYERQYPDLVMKLETRRETFIKDIKDALAGIDELDGLWSIDFMLHEDKAWLIDMAVAQMSAYWDPVRANLN